MKPLSYLLVLAFAAAPVAAQPKQMSQNPRAGLLGELRFREGSTRLPDAAGSQLGRIAAWADEHFDGLVVVDSHADRIGPLRGNLSLSMRRARLVRDQLVALGVDPAQIVIGAFTDDSHRNARVAIWGTRNSLEQVMAMQRGRPGKYVVIPPYEERPTSASALTRR